MGTHQTRFDAKGRMSVPAAFRTMLRTGSEDGAASLVLRPSHKHSCIEAWPSATFQALAGSFDGLDVFSADQDDLTTALYADAWPVEPDKEGRIVVPESLVQHAGLTDSVVFMGLGRLFQIWEPAAASRRIASAREGVVSRGLTLPAATRATP
ncbi:MAG: transcriptional regulator MraZ [Acetobacteraceae bacterium]